MSRLRRLIALPRSRQALLLECACALLRASWRVRRWPFSRLASTLGAPSSPAAGTAPAPGAAAASAADPSIVADVRWAVAAWARVWPRPRPPTCLMQAVAARQVLVRRGLPCEIFFGVRGPIAGPEPSPQEFTAHAWLRCGGLIVTGAAEAARFQPIAVYRSGPAAAPA